ncbi:MAG TPA: hypothetical protein VNL14_13875 [Candidatus Acidoferrales bacterium]|nr:hypothetical protein [Candidatus Acidoferrales bacterium]
MALNEQLASVRLSYLCHRIPGLRLLGRTISPSSYFAWTRFVAGIAYYAYPADWRRMRYMRAALASFPAAEVKRRARENILYRKWMRTLIHGWPSWANRCHEWVRVEGSEHLTEALGLRRGAVLLSGHAYGLVTLVAPVLSRQGYRLNRIGRGLRGDPEKRWGRPLEHEGWTYSTFGGDFWDHVRAL